MRYAGCVIALTLLIWALAAVEERIAALEDMSLDLGV